MLTCQIMETVVGNVVSEYFLRQKKETFDCNILRFNWETKRCCNLKNEK